MMRACATFVPCHFLTLLLTTLLLNAHTAIATTKTFDDTNAVLSYGPDGAWTTVSDGSLAGGSAHSTSSSGATLSFSFAGEQVIIIGSADGSFEVTIDGSSYQQSGGQEAGSTLFTLSHLDKTTTHTAVLTSQANGQALAIDQIKVAFTTSLGIAPSLVAGDSSSPSATATPASAATPSSPALNLNSTRAGARFTTVTRTATTGSPLPSSTPASAIPTSSISSSANGTLASANGVTKTHKSGKAGVIAGATIGGVLGLALIVLASIFARRHWKRRVESGYWDQDTGKGQRKGPHGFIAGGTRSSYNSTQPGIASDEKGVPTVMVTSSSEDAGWLGTLNGGGSWRKKWDRLRETRKFYGLGGSNSNPNLAAVANDRASTQFPSKKILVHPGPPPAEPLPAQPAMQQVESSRLRPFSFFSFPRPPPKITVAPPTSPPFSPPARPVTPPSRYPSEVPSTSANFSPITDPTIIRPIPQTPTRSHPTRPFHSPKTAAEFSPTSGTTTYSPTRNSQIRRRTASQDFGSAPPAPPPPSTFQRLVKSAEKKKERMQARQSPKKSPSFASNRPSYASQDTYFSHATAELPKDSSARILAALMDAETDDESEDIQAAPAFWQKRIVPVAKSSDWRNTMETTSELNYGTSIDGGDSEEELDDNIPRRRW